MLVIASLDAMWAMWPCSNFDSLRAMWVRHVCLLIAWTKSDGLLLVMEHLSIRRLPSRSRNQDGRKTLEEVITTLRKVCKWHLKSEFFIFRSKFYSPQTMWMKKISQVNKLKKKVFVKWKCCFHSQFVQRVLLHDDLEIVNYCRLKTQIKFTD